MKISVLRKAFGKKIDRKAVLKKKRGFSDYVAAIILLIVAVIIGLKFKETAIAQMDTIFTWWGTQMNNLTSTSS